MTNRHKLLGNEASGLDVVVWGCNAWEQLSQWGLCWCVSGSSWASPFGFWKAQKGMMRRVAKVILNSGLWPVLHSFLCLSAQGGSLNCFSFWLLVWRTWYLPSAVKHNGWLISQIIVKQRIQHNFWKNTALPCFLGFQCPSASIPLHRRRELTDQHCGSNTQCYSELEKFVQMGGISVWQVKYHFALSLDSLSGEEPVSHNQ